MPNEFLGGETSRERLERQGRRGLIRRLRLLERAWRAHVDVDDSQALLDFKVREGMAGVLDGAAAYPEHSDISMN